MEVEGVPHEFMAMPGVVEDVTEIILNIKKLALLAAVDGRNHTADGRGEEDAGVVLIKEQRATSLYLVTNLNQQLGCNVLVIKWANSVRLRHWSILQASLGLTYELDVETFT